jgi:hypothetical protein
MEQDPYARNHRPHRIATPTPPPDGDPYRVKSSPGTIQNSSLLPFGKKVTLEFWKKIEAVLHVVGFIGI